MTLGALSVLAGGILIVLGFRAQSRLARFLLILVGVLLPMSSFVRGLYLLSRYGPGGAR